jgi:hypothetical protein
MPKEKEKTIEENLKDPLFINYNLLKQLEEIKKINYSILELLNIIYQKSTPNDKEGVFKPN